MITLQISRYFSRLSTLNKSGRLNRDRDANADEDEDKDDVLTTEVTSSEQGIACSRLSVSGGLKKRAGDEWGLVGKKERSGEPVSIVLKTLNPVYQLLVYPLIGYF